MGLLMLSGMGLGLVCAAADFNGDGTGDMATFRGSTGLWSVQGITRMYWGGTDDLPVPGDYAGNGTDSAAIFRPANGMWSVRDITRVYFGSSSDQILPGDYNADRTTDIAIFRPSNGMWSVRNITRTYFGGSTDVAIAAGTVKDPYQTMSNSGGVHPSGFYEEFNLADICPDLSSDNIVRDATIFGVGGSFECE
jgi:hypothetical protein